MPSRDQRFAAAHRGGPLDRERHCLIAVWAADCAEHVLRLFEEHGSDRRPHRAIATAREWSKGKLAVGAARDAAVAAHAAAREARDEAAVAAARSAGHAAATANMADHCLGAAMYAWKAVEAAGGSVKDEKAWQLQKLPAEIRPLIESALYQGA